MSDNPTQNGAEERGKKERTMKCFQVDDETHPFNKWWKEHGQFMMAGGGRKEFIWACRGWIAREQLAEGVEVTGETEPSPQKGKP